MPQYAIQDVFDLEILDYNTKKPLMPHIDYATVSTNNLAATRTPITGGHGNQRLYAFDVAKTSDLAVTVPLVDAKLLAYLSGRNIASGVQKLFKREVLTVAEGGTATLSDTLAGSMYLTELTGKRDYGEELIPGEPTTDPNAYSVSDNTITLDATTYPAGSKLVAFYQYDAPETSQTIQIDADKFPGYCTMIGNGLWDDQETGIRKPVQMHVYKAKPQGSFAITMDAANPTTLQMTFDMFAESIPDANRSAYVDYTVIE